MRRLIATTALASGLVLVPVALASPAAASAGSGTVLAADTSESNSGDDTGKWGLAGLAGLAGLFGYKKYRDHRGSHDRTGGSGTTQI